MAMSEKVRQQVVEAVEALRRNGGNQSEAAKELGIPRATYCSRLRRAQDLDKQEIKHAGAVPLEPKCEFSESAKGVASLEVSDTRVLTLEDALRKACVDTTVWEVERFVVNSWEVGAKDDTGAVRVTPLWQVKAWLRRVVPKPVETAIRSVIASEKAKSYRTIKPRRKPVGSVLHEISLFDAHLGKLAWKPEVGENYDIEIALGRIMGAVDRVIELAGPYSISKYLLPIGQDFYNVDYITGSTVNDTRQDQDGRYHKMFEAGCRLFVEIIRDRLLPVAPVDVIFVPGNHDHTSSYHLCHYLSGRFDGNKHVGFDIRPVPRKYHEWGSCMLGFTHGNMESHAQLPAIMATEQPHMWGRCGFREWHLGHFHKRKEQHFTPVNEENGVVLRVLPSLSGTDYWHYQKGYVGGTRALDSFLWHKEDGLVGMLPANMIGDE